MSNQAITHMAQAHLENVKQAILELINKKTSLENEIETMTKYYEAGVKILEENDTLEKVPVE
jgi:hypothetical protein